MIFTLISLTEFDGVFRGLYFFSICGCSDGPELIKKHHRAVKYEAPHYGNKENCVFNSNKVLWCYVWKAVLYQQTDSKIPWPLEDGRLDVVLVTKLWGNMRLLSRGWVERIHLQSYANKKVRMITTFRANNILLRVHLPMERIFVWLGAWALGFSFFFSSSPLFSFTSGTLLSSFFLFFSKTWSQS